MVSGGGNFGGTVLAEIEQHRATVVTGLDGFFAECTTCQLESPLSDSRDGAQVHAYYHLVEWATKLAPEPGPCPTWCVNTPCGYEIAAAADVVVVYSRFHAAAVNADVIVEQVERFDADGVTWDPPRVQLLVELAYESAYTPERARELAAALTSAADLVELLAMAAQ